MSEIKKAIEAVEKDFEKREKDRQIEEIKQVAGTILERISAKEKQKAEIEEEIKTLKKNINDLKSGNIKSVKETVIKKDASQCYIPFRYTIYYSSDGTVQYL